MTCFNNSNEADLYTRRTLTLDTEDRVFTFPEDPTKSDLPSGALRIRSYFRPFDEIIARGKSGEKCATMPELMNWILKQLHESEEEYPWLLAYGQMIHLFREKDFVHKNGRYIDDDMDTWALPETILWIIEHEEELFEKFGWTMRLFGPSPNVITFLQIIASCGHDPATSKGKVTDSEEPAIELYPLIPALDDDSVLIDAWQGTHFPRDWVLPAQNYTFKSTVLEDEITLELAANYDAILECLYGDWSVQSNKHAGVRKVCGGETATE